MWGLGVILHELCTTKLPFYDEDENTYKKNIVNEPIDLDDCSDWEDISNEA